MVKVNRCTGEVEYPNGCTAAGYLCCTLSTLALVITIPMLHWLYFQKEIGDALGSCLDSGLHKGFEEKDEISMLSMYYRYTVADKKECNLEQRVLRECKKNETQILRFVQYPPGPLRSKNFKDIEESFEYIRDIFQDDKEDEACVKPGKKLRSAFTHLTVAPFNVSLQNVAPFDGIIQEGKNVTYMDFTCMAAVDWVITKVNEALAKNGQIMDLVPFLKDFFEQRHEGLCYVHVDDAPGNCPGEKDTHEGDDKGSDKGYKKCDFVEYLNFL